MRYKGLDEGDMQIIEALKKEGRISYRVLGDRLHIGHTTVFGRVKRLVRDGVIKRFTVEIDEDKLKERELRNKSKEDLIKIILED